MFDLVLVEFIELIYLFLIIAERDFSEPNQTSPVFNGENNHITENLRKYTIVCGNQILFTHLKFLLNSVSQSGDNLPFGRKIKSPEREILKNSPIREKISVSGEWGTLLYV